MTPDPHILKKNSFVYNFNKNVTLELSHDFLVDLPFLSLNLRNILTLLSSFHFLHFTS